MCCNSEVISVMLEKVIVGLCCSRTINGFESQSDHPSVWDRVDIAYVFFFLHGRLQVIFCSGPRPPWNTNPPAPPRSFWVSPISVQL